MIGSNQLHGLPEQLLQFDPDGQSWGRG